MSSPPSSAYLGVWTDYSNGKVLGRSITVTNRRGDYILTFTGLFIGSFVMAAFWAIVRFAVHYIRAPITDSDGFHYQQQVIYRNNSDPFDAGNELFCVWKPWSSKNRGRNKSWRGAVWLLLPMIIFVAFQSAAILSSHIAASADESSDVLVQAGNCGIWGFSVGTTNAATAYELKVLNDTLGGRAYARSCYSADLSAINPVSCSFYTRKNLFFNSTVADCPFGDREKLYPDGGICNLNGNKEAHVMDTGRLDSNNDFGINAPLEDRVDYRKQVTCSPVSMDGFTSACVGPGTTGLTYTCYNVGSLPGQDYTYLYDPRAATENIGYQITAVVSNAASAYDLWKPTSNFNRSDADVSLYFFAANGVLYRNPVSDPFFNATFNVTFPGTGSSTLTFYQPHDLVAVMGCIDQYQMCNPTTNTCTSLSGLRTVANGIATLDLNTAQTVTAQRLSLLSVNTNTFSSVYGTGGEALKASNKVLDFRSPGLLNNQWQIEVEGWFETSLAKMQAYAVEYADVTANLNEFDANGTVDFLGATGSTYAAWQAACSKQKISNTGDYQTFSFLGVVFIVVVGGVIILISYVLNYVAEKLCKPGNPRRIAYVADGNLQLQRMAFIGAGYVDWKDGDEEVPYAGEMLLPHPILVQNHSINYPPYNSIHRAQADGNDPAESNDTPRSNLPGRESRGNTPEEDTAAEHDGPQRRPEENAADTLDGNIAVAPREAAGQSLAERTPPVDTSSQRETPVADAAPNQTENIEPHTLTSPARGYEDAIAAGSSDAVGPENGEHAHVPAQRGNNDEGGDGAPGSHLADGC